MFTWMGLLEASVAGGICIILFFFASMLCGERYRAGYKKIIWFLIALRLCIPASSSIFPQLFTVQLPAYVLWERENVQDAGNGSSTNAPVDVGAIITDGSNFVTAEGNSFTAEAGNIVGSFAVGEGISNIGIPASGVFTGNDARRQVNLRDIMVGLWVCGSLIVLLYYLIGHFMFYRSMMRKSEVCKEENILRAVSEMAAQLKLKRVPQIRIANQMETGPFTIGCFRNQIVLPDADYEEKDLRYVIRHEMVHCAGRDAQFKLIFILVNIIHWFNPLVWVMKTLADQDMELSCDEKVLASSTKDERREYSEVIMSHVTVGAPGKSVLFAGYAHDVKFLKKRFSSIFNTNKKSGKVIGCFLVILLMLISGLIGFETGQTVYARENGEMDSHRESAFGLTGYGDFSNTGIFQGILNAIFNGDSYSSTDSSEYLQFEGFRGKSTLSIFPKTIEEVEVIDYLYQYMDTLFDPTAEIYLECHYDEDAYQAEVMRLKRIQAERDGKVQTVIYDTESFAFPAYVTINGNDHCYEYALLLGDGKIAYIFLQFVKEEEIAFSADYLPKAYEEEDKGYSLYIFYQENGDGYFAAPSEE